MAKELLSIREITEPIIGGYWGKNEEGINTNACVVRNGDVLDSGEISTKAPDRTLTDKEIEKAKLQKGDLLITMSGNVGRVARVRNPVSPSGLPYVASNFVKILRVNNKISSDFLYYFLKGDIFQTEAKKFTRGVAIQNMSVKIFDQKIVPELSEADQKEIVGKLNKIESLSGVRSGSDEKMKRIVPALMNKTFKSKKWNRVKVIDIAPEKGKIRTGPFGSQLHHDEFTEEGVPVLGIDNIVTNTFRWGKNRNLPKDKYEKFKRFRVYPNDVIVTIMGTVGRVVVTPDDLPECMSTKHLCVITPDTEKINPVYLWASLRFDEDVRRQTRYVSKGAIMEGWNSTIIKNLEISLPPIELQNEFADKVRKIHEIKKQQKETRQKINNLFSSVLQNSFNHAK